MKEQTIEITVNGSDTISKVIHKLCNAEGSISKKEGLDMVLSFADEDMRAESTLSSYGVVNQSRWTRSATEFCLFDRILLAGELDYFHVFTAPY